MTSHQARRLVIGLGVAALLLPATLTGVLAQGAAPAGSATRQTAAAAGNAGRGQAVFDKLGCAGCHGEKGEGTMGPRIAPVSRPLAEFTSFLRKPSASMSPLSRSDASDAQVADLYAYLSSLAPKGAAVAAALPPGNAENGKKLFMAAACYACHGYVGQGGSAGPRLGPPAISFAAFIGELRNPREDMPPYTAKVFSDAQVADMYAFVKTFPEPPALDSIPLLKP